MKEQEIKLKLFEIIANNSEKLTQTGYYMTPDTVAKNVEAVYYRLFDEK